MQIEEVPFVVVDTETTGIRPADHRVIEVAAVTVRGGRIVERWSQLVNPGRAVPRRISEITGITTAMLYDQPPAGEVFETFLDRLGDGVLVAHNLTFDQGFLDAELRRLDRPLLSNDRICTLRLARRLLRGLRSKALPSVADFFGVKIEGRHRALGDAEATAEILLRFLEQLKEEHGVETLDDLLAFQYRSYRQIRKVQPRHLVRIREDRLVHLPDRPGVYFMKDAKERIVYIGKAKSLRDRVRSYFTAVESHPPRLRKLVQTVRDVTWEETGSELAALLLESRLIKEHQPLFNRAQRRYRNRPFIKLDVGHAAPRVTWTSVLRNDGAEYFGPLGGRRQAELVVDLVNRFYRLRECDDDRFARGGRCLYADLDRCDAPCEIGTPDDVRAAYDHEVQRVRDFLTGKDRTVLERLDQAMRRAAAELDFEEARTYRDWIRQVEHLFARQECVAAPVLEHHAVLVQPGVRPGTAQCFVVRYGRHVETVEVPLPPGPEAVVHLSERLARHFERGDEAPEMYLKREVDELRILAHWMYVHRGEGRQVAWDPSQPFEAFREAVLEAVAASGEGAR